MFGTNAPLSADISLALSILVALALTVGLVLAVLKRYEAHRWVQTAAVILNILLICSVMLGSFFKGVTPSIPAKLDQPYYLIALLHGIAGLVAALFGTFVMLRGNNLVPERFKFNNYKLFMRPAYGLYMLATALGVWLYVIWYATPSPVLSDLETVVQSDGELIVPMADFAYNPSEIVIPVGGTVIWVNQDGAPHNAIADDQSFSFDLIGGGEQASTTFSTVGEFPFYCELHGAPGGQDMAGVVRVVPADQAPPAPVVAALPGGALPHLDALLVAGPGLPARQGYATGLTIQADELLHHAQLISEAQAAGDSEAIRRHAEHVYNLISGSLDPQFGDLNGDGRPQNPGDGFGLLPNGTQPGYIQAIETATQAAADAPDSTDAIRLHASHVLASAANLRGWATEARALALELSSDPASINPADLLILAEAIQRGVDLNGDGEIAPVPGEGGALVVYEHANFMAGLLLP